MIGKHSTGILFHSSLEEAVRIERCSYYRDMEEL